MSVRVVARIRPLLKAERESEIIVRTSPASDNDSPSTCVRIPNPKNEAEQFSFQFAGVYDGAATQEEIFQAEVAPTLTHLFKGGDVTLFAYGVTGTGKTHTMRGGKSLAERGVIPRLLSGIFRKGRKMEKSDGSGATHVRVSMSYYEIYNDRVFDLFEPAEKRTATGLALREQHGKTVVVGLTERPCVALKEFERLYDQANVNRSTSATKLNAHSSRSHAILGVKITVETGDQVRVSTACAIDLAGSEDNRRTENGKERLVESASINKSLCVLAQCVEAIGKKQSRIPYRESKMTRILSLGQNNGLTLMILNLAPVRAYHLDSLSSLNFANRTKRIEVNERENEPIFNGGCSRPAPSATTTTRSMMIDRQPLKPLTNVDHPAVHPDPAAHDSKWRPAKTFSVYSDRGHHHQPLHKRRADEEAATTDEDPTVAKKRKTESSAPLLSRRAKTHHPPTTQRIMPAAAPGTTEHAPVMSKADLEDLVERKVEEVLAARAMRDLEAAAAAAEGPVPAISEKVRQRLDALEERIETKESAKADGLTYLLMAKQHQVRGEDGSALKMYQLARPFFPDNQKLAAKMTAVQQRMDAKKAAAAATTGGGVGSSAGGGGTAHPGGLAVAREQQRRRPAFAAARAPTLLPVPASHATDLPPPPPPPPPPRRAHTHAHPPLPTTTRPPPPPPPPSPSLAPSTTPRTDRLLTLINRRDPLLLQQQLKGVGRKKAAAIIDALYLLDADQNDDNNDDDDDDGGKAMGSGSASALALVAVVGATQLTKKQDVTTLEQVARFKGVGWKMVREWRREMMA
ncbi:MAG: hypothetical protein M1826_001435 [Phylliscum demangeonii]|nr:MAG: hypothetical protein M1826_001435 [Phylliscum demangeonii]